MEREIRNQGGRGGINREKILNRFLWGLGFAVIALFLAVGLKSIFKPAMQEAIPIAKEMAEPQGKLAQQEKEESILEEEFSQAPISPAAGGMKQIARASSREEREIAQNQPAFVKELKEAGIEVKEVKPAESTNKLFASNPRAIGHYMKIINETKPATNTALPYVPGEILVSEISPSGTVEFSTVKVEPGTEAEAIDVLSGLPGTRAELNRVFRIFLLGYPQSDEPNDEEYGKQWGLGKIGILGAWDKAKEKNASPEEVIIAILDTGADLDHPDLVGKIDTALDHNFINGESVAEDDNGHGTHVAGIIGAMIDNIEGIAGIVPEPKLMILKVLDANGNQTDANKVKEALSYALTNKAKIINMSFGGIGDWLVNPNGTANQQFKAVWDTVVDSDVLLVAAAGNHGGDGANSEDCVLYPAKYDGVLAVGGTNRDNKRWVDENTDNDGSTDSAAPDYNPWKGQKFQSAYGEEVDIAAPAGVNGTEDIYSTILDGEYGYMPGTSMAAAFVSGVAGLLLTANPYLSKDDLIEIIQGNADIIDTGETGKPIGGLINAEAAVEAALELMPMEDEIWIRGKVKNGEGEPQENIVVKMQLKNETGEEVGEIEESEPTDADGNYEIVLYTPVAASAGTLGVSALSTGPTYSVDLKAPIERNDFRTGLTPGAISGGSENDINTSGGGGGDDPGGGGDEDLCELAEREAMSLDSRARGIAMPEGTCGDVAAEINGTSGNRSGIFNGKSWSAYAAGCDGVDSWLDKAEASVAAGCPEGGTGATTTPKADGASCSTLGDDNGCESGYCGATSGGLRCTTRPGPTGRVNGVPCSSHGASSECESGYCGNTRQGLRCTSAPAKKTINESCSGDDECASGNCGAGKCIAALDPDVPNEEALPSTATAAERAAAAAAIAQARADLTAARLELQQAQGADAKAAAQAMIDAIEEALRAAGLTL